VGPTPVVGSVAYHVYGDGSRRVGDHMLVGKAKLAYLGVETTGLSPAMGDRIVQIGIVACWGRQEVERLVVAAEPGSTDPCRRPARPRHQRWGCCRSPRVPFARQGGSAVLHDTWIVGHNVWFDAGFGSLRDDLAKVRRDWLVCTHGATSALSFCAEVI